MKSRTKKIVSLLLALCLLASLLPAAALAAAAGAPDGTPDVVVFGARNGKTGRFPDVTKNHDGTLVATCYWNKIEAHAPWGYGDPLGEIWISHGSADGAVWSTPELLISPKKLA